MERDEVGRQAAGEDRDDREGDGEVGEAAHLPDTAPARTRAGAGCARPHWGRTPCARCSGCVAIHSSRSAGQRRDDRAVGTRCQRGPDGVRLLRCSASKQLREEVESGAIDTVVAAFTDMQGRLMGKRLHAEFFLEELDAGHPVEGCNYLLALEMEMEPVPGYGIASWERGYGDFDLRPDLATLRRVPWHRGDRACPLRRALARRVAGRAVAAPGAEGAGGARAGARLRGDVRLRARVLPLQESYEEAHAKHYRGLTPSVPYILDYHILACDLRRAVPARRSATAMQAAGMRVE